ncbi:PrsW family intramembrane metalloprotease [Candidatus Wolfebacteria bacterium]|nr:PrsW family intramembrane metalloprotease [Candidatus Wolfebacteria bacterium]
MVIFLSIIFGVLPSLIWLLFFLKEDDHPEPKKMIAKTFIFGAVLSLAAVFLQRWSLKILSFAEIQKYSLTAFLILALIEEAVKFFAAYLAVNKKDFFDEPIDAMIYMVTAAMGFAAMENIFVATASGMENKTLTFQMMFGVLVLRFMGATLLHALSSLIIGYYWAKNFFEQKSKIMRQILIGFFIAVSLHAVFNFIIIKYNALTIYSTILLTIAALFIFWDFEKIRKS